MDKTNLVEYLVMVSNKNLYLNIGIHLLIIISIVALFFLKDLKVKKYILNTTLLALFLSVTITALIYGNPFHAITIGILVILAGFELIKDKKQLGIPQKNIRAVVSFLFILLGLWYPELVKANAFEYFIISPVGVVPCPTLITALGMLNLYYHDVNKKLFAATVFFGLIYGVIGTFKLGVYYDICLITAVIFSIYNMLIGRNEKVNFAQKEI